MILNGNQRGGARDLTLHLMKPENEHVEVHEIRGFVAETLAGALREAEAISKGTRCRQFLYSLSLSPPETEHVPVAVFERAVERIEERLGLTAHPRVVVFHEKKGRRHAHCIWSRIDTATMTAVRMSHDRRKLTELSRELYLEHRWKMPDGLIDPALRNPLNFNRQEWFKAKRASKDPRDIKAAFQQCWVASDSGKAFRQALEQRGYYLARGDRRAVVAVDVDGEVYAVARWASRKTKEINYRIGDLEGLPSVTEAQQHVATLVQEKLKGVADTLTDEFSQATEMLEARRLEMVQRHRALRRELQLVQNARAIAETRHRAEKFRKGVRGLWDRVTGRHAKLRSENDRTAAACARRNLAEKQNLIDSQLDERRRLQSEITEGRRLYARDLARLHRDTPRAEPSADTAHERSRERRRSGPALG